MAQGTVNGAQDREGSLSLPPQGIPNTVRTRPAGGDAEPPAWSPERVPPRAAPARAPAEPRLVDVAQTLLERRWTVAVVAAAVLAAAAAYLLIAPPVYESSVLVQVEARNTRVPALPGVIDTFEAETPVEGEMRIIRSRALVESVVDQLALDVDVRWRRAPLVGEALARRHVGTEPAPARLGLARYAWGGERLRVGRLAVSAGLEGKPVVLTALEGGRFRIAAAGGALVAEGAVGEPAAASAGGRSVELLVTELAARPGTEAVLTKLPRMEIVDQLERALTVTPEGRHTGLVTVALTGTDPVRVAAILNALSETYVRHSTERTSLEASRTLDALEAQLPPLKASMDKADRAVHDFRRVNGPVELPAETQALLTRVGELDRAIGDDELHAAELTRRYTGQHPDVAPLRERAEKLRGQRAAIEARMRTLPDLELTSTTLTRQARVATELYLSVLNRAVELQIVKSGWMGNVRVLEKAVVPYRPVRPSRRLVAILAVVLGLGAGIAVALARAALEGAKDPVDLEAATGVPTLATITRSAAQRRLARRGRRGRLLALTAAEPGDAAVEDLRALRTSVQFALSRAHNRVVAIGGLAPGAGKSFVSVNLAHLLAGADGRVLLVDGDLRGGILHRYFGLAPHPGLSDVMTGGAELDTAVRRTDVPNLDLLAAGRPLKNPSELLSGPRFEELLAEVGRRYAAVVVDTPPILSVTDAALVGRHAGVNLLVVGAGRHPVGEIQLALRRLAQNGVAVRGTILNELVPSQRRYGQSGAYRARRVSAGA